MSNSTLSVSDIAENLATIEEDTYTEAQLATLGAAHDKFAYTSTVLTALAEHVGNLGDTKAQLLLLGMAGTMAVHEAQTI